MSWNITQRDMEHFLGLREVAMIRLPLTVWASAAELQQLTQVAASDPMPTDWPELQSKIARKSPGFRDWLRKISQRDWVPDDNYVKGQLAKIDFSMPWCARLRWGERNLKNVDVFIHATGGAGSVEWETV